MITGGPELTIIHSVVIQNYDNAEQRQCLPKDSKRVCFCAILRDFRDLWECHETAFLSGSIGTRARPGPLL